MNRLFLSLGLSQRIPTQLVLHLLSHSSAAWDLTTGKICGPSCARSKQTTLNFVLLIAGTGHAEAYWKRQVADLGLSRRVRFLGFCDDIPRLLEASDLLLAPSHYEPYGIAMHEAVISGVPVITTRQAGFSELYTDELNSFVLNDPDDADELLGKLLRCHAEPERSRSAFSPLSHRLRCYTWNAMADRIIETVSRAGTLGKSESLARRIRLTMVR
jgi:glycosyltransferase involved in cell wall biosynthesis